MQSAGELADFNNSCPQFSFNSLPQSLHQPHSCLFAMPPINRAHRVYSSVLFEFVHVSTAERSR